MTCPNFHLGIIRRSDNRSATGNASYICRQTIDDERTGKRRRPGKSKKDLGRVDFYFPKNFSNKKMQTVSGFANAIDAAAGNNDRVARTFLLCLPAEASPEMQQEMVALYVDRAYLSQGIPVMTGTHVGERNTNNHVHGILPDAPMGADGNLVAVKSRNPYVDQDENEIQKIQTPILDRNKHFRYNPDGTLATKPGYQKIERINDDGTVVLTDIRCPVRDDDGNPVYTKNGKYMKPSWRRKKIPVHNLDSKGIKRALRMLWQDCQNEIFRKYDIRDRAGNLVQVDLRSIAEQYADIPEAIQPMPTIHEGRGPQASKRREENVRRKKYNDSVMPLIKLYRSSGEYRKLIDKALATGDMDAINKIVNRLERKTPVHEKEDSPGKADAPDEKEKIKTALMEKMITAMQERDPNLTKEQIVKDLANPKNFVAALRFVADTPEAQAWERVQRKPGKKGLAHHQGKPLVPERTR